MNPSDPPPPNAPKRRRWAVIAATLLILIGAGFLLSQRPQKSASNGASTPAAAGRGRGGGAVSVGILPVKLGNIGVYINALGTVTPVYTVTVTSRVVGQLMEVRFREGQMVKKGDLLAVLDPRPYQAALTQAQGQLARDQATLKNSFIDLDRYRMIYAQKAIPEQTLATQQATVEQNQGTVKIDQGNLDAAQVNYDYTRITSPITGRVGLRLVDPGNIVQANGTAGLATITQLQPITVIFTMAEDYLSEVAGQLRAGRQLHVDALDRSNQDVLARGTVLTIDNSIDTTTGTVKVRASFSNRDFKLFPNEFVNARLLVKTLNNVNLIPTAAIQRNNDLAFVYVVTPGSTVQSRNIAIATTDGFTAAVTGVKAGENLVVDGFDRLQDGIKVVARKEPPPDASGGKSAANAAGEQASSNSQPDGSRQPGQATPAPQASQSSQSQMQGNQGSRK